MRPDMNRSPALRGIAWTGGVLGALLTLAILVDVAMKISQPPNNVDAKVQVSERTQELCPLAMAVAHASGPAIGSVIRQTIDNAQLTIFAPVALATLLFLGFTCAAECADA